MHELDYSSRNSVQRVIRSARTATLRAAYDSPGVTFRSCRGPEAHHSKTRCTDLGYSDACFCMGAANCNLGGNEGRKGDKVNRSNPLVVTKGLERDLPRGL